MSKPSVKPNNPNFSSGPCAKRPGWSLAGLEDAWLSRSHRAAGGKAKLKEVIDRHVDLLKLPEGYRMLYLRGMERHQVCVLKMMIGLKLIVRV